jgi:hypothetical protein
MIDRVAFMAHIMIHESTQDLLKQMHCKDSANERKIVLDTGPSKKAEYYWNELLRIGIENQNDMLNLFDPGDTKFADFEDISIIEKITAINPTNGSFKSGAELKDTYTTYTNKYDIVRNGVNASGQNAAGSSRLEKAYSFCGATVKNLAQYYVFLLWDEFADSVGSDNFWLSNRIDNVNTVDNNTSGTDYDVRLSKSEKKKLKVLSEMTKNIVSSYASPTISSSNSNQSELEKLNEIKELGDILTKQSGIIRPDILQRMSEKYNNDLEKYLDRKQK